MMVVLLPATARRARRTQREHDLQEGGWWCRACLRNGDGKVMAGKCQPYLVAEGLLVAYARQQADRRRPARGRASVRPGRVWP